MAMHPFEQFLLSHVAADLRRHDEAAEARAYVAQTRREEAAILNAADRARNERIRDLYARTEPNFEQYLVEARKAHGLP